MRAIWGLALLLFGFATTAFAQADLQVTSAASASIGLIAGQEFLVTTTIRNNGPNAATSVSGSLSLSQQESYWFEFLGSATPGCDIEFIDINPPTFLLFWSYPSLAAGQSQTCVARLSVQFVPPGNSTQLFAHVDSQPIDPVPGNDTASIPLSFQTPGSKARHTIPATSTTGLLLLLLGFLVISLVDWHKGRA